VDEVPRSDHTETDESILRVRPWVVYVLFAIAWPVFLQALIIVPSLMIGVGETTGVWISGLGTAIEALTPVIVGLLAWWGGSKLARAGAPRRLWIVPCVWAATAAIPTGFAFAIADSRSLAGLWGVVGTVAIGALGFWWGTTRGSASAARDRGTGHQSRI
jgi:hypothetical protein